METEFRPREIIWTPQKISRFWDYYVLNKEYEETFFSRIAGDAVIDFANRFSNLNGNVLDYGCGRGFLIEKLLKRGILCHGLEFSADSAKKVEEKFKDDKKFGGVTLAQSLPSTLESDCFDFLFVIETVEHLLPEWLDPTLKELFRITKKGGLVLVTVPNEENLEAVKVMCPDCGAIFHTMQHISSWSKQTLARRFSDAGFLQVACVTTRFRESGRLSRLRHISMMIAHKLMNRKMPHLIYIGRKSA